MGKRFLAHIRNQWIGVLALFIALATGGAYAAAQIGSDDIKRNAVRSTHIKNGQVRPADLKSRLPHVVIRGEYIASTSGTVDCNPGEVATGGGVGVDVQSTTYVARSEPSPNSGVPRGWTGHVRYRADGAGASGSVFAICASP